MIFHGGLLTMAIEKEHFLDLMESAYSYDHPHRFDFNERVRPVRNAENARQR